MTFDEAVWRKSSRSSGDGNGNCVEVAIGRNAIGVRDTKDRGVGPILTFTPAEWDAFVGTAKAGKFDLSLPLAARA
jgi:hypothetical protein